MAFFTAADYRAYLHRLGDALSVCEQTVAERREVTLQPRCAKQGHPSLALAELKWRLMSSDCIDLISPTNAERQSLGVVGPDVVHDIARGRVTERACCMRSVQVRHCALVRDTR